MRLRRSLQLAFLALRLVGCASPNDLEPPAELIEPAPDDGKADTSSRPAWVRSQIELWNEDLDEEARAEKYARMAESPWAFFRGTNHLFWSQSARDSRLARYGGTSRTRTFIQGDLHPDNFGAFHDDDGRIVYDLNDFDEGLIADYQLDVWHMAIGVVLVARANGLGDSAQRALVDSFAESYLDELENVRGNEQETDSNFDASATYGGLDEFLDRVAANESRLEMLEEWTLVRNGVRVFDPNNPELARVDASLQRALTAGIVEYGTTLSGGLDWNARYFRVKSVAQRLGAGVGSLGVPRYYVLIEGSTTSQSDDVLLDVKRQELPSGYYFLSRTERTLNRNSFVSDADRVITSQDALSNDTDDHLGWLELADGTYSVRERSPYKKSFDTATLTSLDEFTPLAEQWGTILAHAHARADRDFDDSLVAGSFEAAVHDFADGDHAGFRALVRSVATEGASRVERDYRSFLALVD